MTPLAWAMVYEHSAAIEILLATGRVNKHVKTPRPRMLVVDAYSH